MHIFIPIIPVVFNGYITNNLGPWCTWLRVNTPVSLHMYRPVCRTVANLGNPQIPVYIPHSDLIYTRNSPVMPGNVVLRTISLWGGLGLNWLWVATDYRGQCHSVNVSMHIYAYVWLPWWEPSSIFWNNYFGPPPLLLDCHWLSQINFAACIGYSPFASSNGT